MHIIDTDEARVAYTDTGTGEPVVLVHCSAASGSAWQSLCQRLGLRFRTIAPDQWGCGHSDPWSGRRAFSLSEEADPILGLLDRIGVPVHLVGHSYGGGVALKVARQRPEMIRSITLVDPSCFHLLRNGDTHELTLFAEISDVADAVGRAVACGDLWNGMGRFVDYWSEDGAWDATSH